MAVNYSAPAAQPPPSYASGSDGPEIKGVTAGHWLDSVGLVLTTLFLGLRIYTKTAISRIFGVDDVCMIVRICPSMNSRVFAAMKLIRCTRLACMVLCCSNPWAFDL